MGLDALFEEGGEFVLLRGQCTKMMMMMLAYFTFYGFKEILFGP